MSDEVKKIIRKGPLTPEELTARAEQLSLKRSHDLKHAVIVALTIVAVAICILCAIIASMSSSYKMEQMRQEYDLKMRKPGCYPI